jgi:hypothetical protein
MNVIISQIQQDLIAEQNVQLAKIGQTANTQLESARKSIQYVSKSISKQEAHINKYLEPVIKIAESIKAIQTNLPDFSLTLKALEQAKRNAVFQIDILAPNHKENLSPAPRVRRVEPRLNPEEIAFFKDLYSRREKMSVGFIREQVTSIFNWDTFDLHIEGQRIKLEPVEKTICMCVFKNPKTRCMRLDTIEETVYGEILSDSKRLKQAIKRINTKIRRAGFGNIFTYSDGFLNINI